MSTLESRRALTLCVAVAAALALARILRRHRAAQAAAGFLDAQGYVVVPVAAAPVEVARMRAAIEAEADKAEAGGYIIWTPAEALPAACREWAETGAAAILQRSLAPGTPAVRLLGGAALWKRAGTHDGTPFHQDFAYAESSAPGSTASRSVRHAAVWLALTPTGPRSGCLRFAPSLGYTLLPHQTLPRETAPSGFETHMVGPSVEQAEAAAVDVLLEPGMAVVIGDQARSMRTAGPHTRATHTRRRRAHKPTSALPVRDAGGARQPWRQDRRDGQACLFASLRGRLRRVSPSGGRRALPDGLLGFGRAGYLWLSS